MHLARKSFRNWRKLRRNGIRRTKGTNSTETTTGLQIRPRTVEQSFRHTMGITTEHLQPIVRNTVGYATTTVREKKVHARFRTTNERYGLRTTSLRNPQQSNKALHHLHDFRPHRRQVHDHYRIVLWLLRQPDDNIHHYQHHLDEHYDV